MDFRSAMKSVARTDDVELSPGRERRRIVLVSVGVLVSATAAVAAIGMGVMYQSAFDVTLQRLQDAAEEQARFIEAVGEFDAKHSPNYPGGPARATLTQVLRAREHFPGFGETGELVLAHREGDRIAFLMTRQRHGAVEREGIRWGSSAAEPMRRALRGESGNLIGVDYRGERVLAVHQPVGVHGWGVVAKIDIAEIRRSFVPAAIATMGMGAFIVAAGVAVLFGVVSPIIRRLELRTRELRHESEERARVEQELAESRSLLVASLGTGEPAPQQGAEAREWAAPYFRALVLDYDGTLTTSGRPSEDLLHKLEVLRKTGVKLVLATGRTMSRLRQEFLDVNAWFDILVVENGALLYRQGIARSLSPPVPETLDDALADQQIPFERGQVLVACKAQHDGVVLEQLSRLHLDCQIARNRAEIMIVPAGVSKGSGLMHALDSLRVSPHNTVAVGDGENDFSMFKRCELGVAVSNALAPVKFEADVVLDLPAGEGVKQLLDAPFLLGQEFLEPKRWRVTLGHNPEGRAVTLPGSAINLLVTGGSGGGKSFSTGLIAEQLIELGYSVCVFDPEGDHVGLGRFRGVVLLGGQEPLPRPEQLARIVQHRFESVVVDLSQRSPDERVAYVKEALHVLKAQRALSGCPHWIVADEAHGSFGTSLAARFVESGDKGYCLVTYLPSALRGMVPITFDYVLVLPGGTHASQVAGAVGAITGIEPEAVERFLGHEGQRGQALLVHVATQAVEALTLAPRTLKHVRHQHKYSSGSVPSERRFYFRTDDGLNGASAGNMVEFYRELDRSDDATLIHHAVSHDFSRWIEAVLRDEELAIELREIEARMNASTSPDRIKSVRRKMLAAIRGRYLARAG